MTHEHRLMVADSDRDANMLYAVRMFIPDPFIFLQIKPRPVIVLNDLELGRARKYAAHCEVVSWNECVRAIQARGGKRPGFAEVIRHLLREAGVKSVLVPANFPLGLAEELRRLGIRVRPKAGAFFPQREVKSADEIKKICGALMMAEVGLAEGIQAVKTAKVGRRRQLMYHNYPLTSEKLRAIIEAAIVQAGGQVSQTIVSTGDQACNAHEPGCGPLRANQPIILDVFPRSQRTGYFGDITRTIVKGRASEAVRALYHTVGQAQSMAFKALRPGALGREIHSNVQRFFADRGYASGAQNGHIEGFCHGTGHGLGLEIHESPRIGSHSPDRLKAGQVVTVEPGLYYHGLGAVRLEDVVLVTQHSPRNLTRFEKTLEV